MWALSAVALTACAAVVWLCYYLHDEVRGHSGGGAPRGQAGRCPQAFGFSMEPLRSREDLKTLTLYSEQAFYYSFFLRAVSAPSWYDAVHSLFVDTTSEFPGVVIPVQRCVPAAATTTATSATTTAWWTQVQRVP